VTDAVTRLRAALADRYRLDRELGQGGMATVYLAHDHKLGRAVALKVLRPELAAALGGERFLREIEIAAKLAHPHILALYDCGEADGLLYYTMPFVEGESLRDRLSRERQLSLDDALRIAREVADALGHAHALGLVHRDIKPENILFQAGHAVVSDFGIARAVSAAGGAHLTETGLAIGTPAYMSPEQAAGSQQLDGRSDLYSLGCVLYEMLSGETPYTGPTPQAILAKKLSEPLPRISVVREAVPAGVEAALNKALARTPADRWTTAGEFAAALAHPETLGGAAAAAPRVWWRRTVARVGAAAVILVAAVVTALVVRGARSSLDPTVFVVAPFENQIRDTSLAQLGDIAADWVAQTLQGTGEIRVVPMAEVAGTKWAPGSRIQDLAAATGAGTVITGRVSLQGDSVYLRADLVDGRRARLLHSVPPVAAPRAEPLEAVKELARRVAGAAAWNVDPVVEGEGSASVRPPVSFEAYRQYAEGFRLEQDGDWMGSVECFERAYALDTTFVRALVEAFAVISNVNDWAHADSLLGIVERRRDRFTRLEQWQLDQYRAYGAGDFQRAAVAAANRARLLPPGQQLFLWGFFALGANRPQEAIHALAEVAPDYPLARTWSPHWWMLAAAYHLLGRHREELKATRRGRRLFPDRPHMINAELRALAALGREGDMLRLLDEARGMAPDPFLSPDVWEGTGPWLPYEAALELRAHGYQDAYRRVIAVAVDWLRFVRVADTSAVPSRWQRAVALYAAERWEEARALYAGLRRADPRNIEFLGGLGVSEARLGHRPEAAAMAASLAATNPPGSFGRSPYWRARIAALLGDREGAVASLREAMSQGISCAWHFGPPQEDCHREMDFEPLRGYAPFDELLRPKG